MSAIIGTLEGVKQNKAEKKSSSLPNSYDSFTFFTNQSPMVRCSASALFFSLARNSQSIEVWSIVLLSFLRPAPGRAPPLPFFLILCFDRDSEGLIFAMGIAWLEMPMLK